MTPPSISVLIPAYNREAYLGAAIASALAQTLPPLEIIVVDDGSVDRTAAIAASFGGKVRCVSQENQGIGGARNTGLKEARGSLISFLDSDDLWAESKLELQAAWLAAHPEIDMVFCHMKPFLSPELDPASAPALDLREIAAVNAASLLARPAAVTRAGLFPVDRSVPEFFPWFTRACDAGCAYHILPQVLLFRRVHLGNSVHDPAARQGYLHFLKQRLDRKRASASPPSPPPSP